MEFIHNEETVSPQNCWTLSPGLWHQGQPVQHLQESSALPNQVTLLSTYYQQNKCYGCIFLGSPDDFSSSLLVLNRSMWHGKAHLESLKTTCFTSQLWLCTLGAALQQCCWSKRSHGINPLQTITSADGEWILTPLWQLWVSNSSCTQKRGKNTWVFLLQPQPQQAPAGRQWSWLSLEHLPWSNRDTLSSSSAGLQLTHNKQTSPSIRIWLSFRPMTHFGRLASGVSNAPAYN